ncbi:hypothetical protein M378DRAFT_124739 [Amanita muscaria Koide BX008]|uniref:AB hydrolase-1 domain-containing protein n=1 Tax=Amanita muscaria (strain Koide BX008) TaxID=946122 RepID=A0A0C2XA13_AMAMK|nr:hypothetical protein M378DRAFT_124739 [Amanita muscaria Koide BX008]
MLPFLQQQIIYMNGIKLPLFADFDHPEKYGLAPNKTINLKITTSDNETIGAWFVMSDKYYHALPSVPSEPLKHMRAALERHPTILFLHGNAATRATKTCINHYNGFTSRLGVNVLAIDYRGFANSTGTPSETGLVLDGRAAFDWLVENGAKPKDILIVGHSLGTGVTSQLVAQIETEKISCRGVVLLAPFSSITHLIDTYHLFGLLPILKPISGFASRDLKHNFDTLGTVPYISSPVLIAHAESDRVIPHNHSDVLFEAFLEPALPTVDIPNDASSLTPEHLADKQEERSRMRKEIVETSVVPNLGTISEARVGRPLTLVKTRVGGHDHVGEQDGLQDVIGRKFGLFD